MTMVAVVTGASRGAGKGMRWRWAGLARRCT
ncbi:MAG: hypothetical protein QOF47_2110 [Mycobacterium sp.]|jgi:NAD(P)-dependent dehydrogenase (short-subunit alcohol dehydrogenase family)|nr:hypothetical protein [Mycobacterium sp.]MDT5333401.1 hypothetical protein [Mycobacterium sp.]